MLGSAVLDTVIGMSFVFFLVALLSSVLAESLANLLRKRPKFLLRGLQALLVEDRGARARLPRSPGGMWASMRAERSLYRAVLDPTVGQAVASDVVRIMAHPLLRASRQTYPDGRYTRLPTYLPAADVALAIVDVLLDDPAPDQVKGRIEALGPSSLARSLGALWAGADGDRDQFLSGIARWYDALMERVSGWYKRWVKRWIVVIGALVVIVFNVDSIAIATSLYEGGAVREAVAAAAAEPGACGEPAPTTQPVAFDGPTATSGSPEAVAECARGMLDQLDAAGLPLGWPADCPVDPLACVQSPYAAPGTPGTVGDWLRTLLGLAITIGAAAFGAPFWFDALGRFGSLRNTGNRPRAINRSIPRSG